MKKCIFLSILVLLISATAYGATYSVKKDGTGDYSTIQQALNAAQPGDTVLVYDGTYYEAVQSVRAGTSGNYITIQSKNYLGAVVDAQSTRNCCFKITHDYLRVVGFWCKNAVITDFNNHGAIIVKGDYCDIMWNKLSNNAVSVGNAAVLMVYGGHSCTVRGNIFEDNSWESCADCVTLSTRYSNHHTIELNHFKDTDTDRYYNMYITTSADYSVIRYNCSTGKLDRIRDSEHVEVYHNYFEGWLDFQDDEKGHGGAQNEYHSVHHNTINYSGGKMGFMLRRCDYSAFEKNLVMGCIAYLQGIWGDCNYNTLTDNDRSDSGVAVWESGTRNTEIGTTASASETINLNPTTKCNDLTNRGSDLDISKWPFTRCNGEEYVSFPYGTTSILPSASFDANPTGGEAPLTVEFTDTSTDSDGTLVSWNWDFGDGGTSTARNPSYTYNNAGTYTATLTVTDDDDATDSASTTISVSSGETVSIHIEAESGTLSSPMVIGNDPNPTACGDAYVYAPAGSGHTTTPTAEAIYDVNIPYAGDYYLWLRMYGPTDDNDAMYIGFNGSFDRVYPTQWAEYEWLRAETVHGSGDFSHTLSAGTNQINIGHGEELARADIILVSDDADFTPVGPHTTNPTITITSPTSTDTYSTGQDSITLSGTASDNVGVTSVTWTNNRGGSGTASGTTDWTIFDITLHCGADNIITVTAKDAAGNSATDTLTIDVKPCAVLGFH